MGKIELGLFSRAAKKRVDMKTIIKENKKNKKLNDCGVTISNMAAPLPAHPC